MLRTIFQSGVLPQLLTNLKDGADPTSYPPYFRLDFKNVLLLNSRNKLK